MATQTRQIIKTNKLTEERMAKIKDYYTSAYPATKAEENQAKAKAQKAKDNNQNELESSRVQKKNIKPVLCEPCRLTIKKEVQASGFCEDCLEYLCSGCVETHRKGRILRTHAHTILLGKEMPRFSSSGEDLYEMCHCKLGVVRYYCKDHNSLICKTCKIHSHRSCRFSDITNISKDFSISREFRNEMKDLRAIRIKCEKLRKACIKEVTDIGDTCSEILLDINKTRQRVTHAIDKFEEDIRKELNHIMAREEAHIKESQVKCETLKETIEKRLASIERLKEQNNEAALFLAFHRKQGETEKFQKSFDAIEGATTEIKVTFIKRDLTGLLNGLETLGQVQLERVSKTGDHTMKPLWATRRPHIVISDSLDTDRYRSVYARHMHRPITKMEVSNKLEEAENSRKRNVKSVPSEKIGDRQSNTSNSSKSTYLRNIRKVAAETKYSIGKKADHKDEALDNYGNNELVNEVGTD